MSDADKPRGDVLGIDEQQVFNQWLGATKEHLDSPKAKQQAEEYRRDITREHQDELYMRVVKRVVNGRVAYFAECVAGLPDTRMNLRVQVEELHQVEPEVKFVFAQLLHKARYHTEWEAAGKRGASAIVRIADVVDAL